MSMSRLQGGPIEKFKNKVVEMLGKGFKAKERHNYAADIEMSRAAYKVESTEVEYIVFKALLFLPTLVETDALITTLREIFLFYQPLMRKLIITHVNKLDCLRAIEDSCIEYDHMNQRESGAFIMNYLQLVDILDVASILEFHAKLLEKRSFFLGQHSYNMLISWVRSQAAKERNQGLEPNDTDDWSDDDEEDDKPLSFMLMRNIDHAFNLNVYKIMGGVEPPKCKPLRVWVTKEGELIDDSDDLSDDDDKEEEEKEVDDQNEEDQDEEDDGDFEVDDPSDFECLYEESDDDYDGPLDLSEMNMDEIPLKFLSRNLTKNHKLMKKARRC